MPSSVLSPRARRLLAALVREHIETGEPVGSHALVRVGGLEVSSATVRTELARLERLGFVHQPHTSAGRVPTDLGYRCYVDLLLQSRRQPRTTAALEADLRERAGRAGLMDDLLSYVSHVVSEASHHVAFALGPENEAAAFHQIDFVPLAGSAVLVVVVARGGQVSEKVVDLGEELDPIDLRQAANYLNSEFAGRTLAEVRALVLERLREDRTLYDALLSRALRLAEHTFQDLPTGHMIFIEGAASLLDEALEAGGMSLETLRAMLRMIEEKHRLIRLLTEYIEGPGLTVVIGAEHRSADLRGFSLVASTYSDGGRIGSVGLIGPTRMLYSRTIPLVDGIAQAVSRVLGERGWTTEPERPGRPGGPATPRK
jgi:heat-inducible transcriptional repressor